MVIKLSGDVAAIKLTGGFSVAKLYAQLFTPRLLYSPLRLVNSKSPNLNL
jgi:hypothetical protein